MKIRARGGTLPEGAEPALNASTRSPPWMRANASAIWLRLLFSTQTNRTRLRAEGSLIAALQEWWRSASAYREIAAGVQAGTAPQRLFPNQVSAPMMPMTMAAQKKICPGYP